MLRIRPISISLKDKVKSLSLFPTITSRRRRCAVEIAASDDYFHFELAGIVIYRAVDKWFNPLIAGFIYSGSALLIGWLLYKLLKITIL